MDLCLNWIDIYDNWEKINSRRNTIDDRYVAIGVTKTIGEVMEGLWHFIFYLVCFQ